MNQKRIDELEKKLIALERTTQELSKSKVNPIISWPFIMSITISAFIGSTLAKLL